MKAFECKRCGECCYGEAGIRVDKFERGKIALFLEMNRDCFLSRFCEKRHGRYYVKTGDDGFCAFYRKGCSIHPVRPEVCRLWPFFPAILKDKDNWEMAKAACPGICRDCTFEDFVKQAPL